MTQTIANYLIALILLGIYALVCLRTDGWRRYAGPGLLLVIAASAGLLYSQSLGKPRPLALNFNIEEARVQSILYDEPTAIYLWVIPSGTKEPVAVTLPWTDDMAQQVRRSEANGGPLMFDGSAGETEKVVHPMPIEALPPKTYDPI